MTREVPVLIVGGGPVGLALALELGWRGIHCELVEQGDGTIAAPKMNEINARSMEFCRRWGIAEEVLGCPFPPEWPLDIVFVTSLSGYELGRMPRPGRRDQVPTPETPMSLQSCPQTWFDPMLLARARSFSGVRIRHGCRLERFTVEADGVRAELHDLSIGTREDVRARYLAAADGANSRVRRALGIGLEGAGILGHPVHIFFRAPELLERCGKRPGTFFLAIDRDGLWANIRVIDPKGALWRLMALDSDGTLTPETVDHRSLLARALGRAIEVEVLGTSVWTRQSVVAERYAQGPVFLLGDAVHQLSPTGALGMNTGLGDAVDLGWKLAAVLDGWGGPNLLASYDAERRPVGHRNVAMATEFYREHLAFAGGTAAIEDDGAAGEALRRRLGAAIAENVGRMFRTTGLQLGYRYDPSPIVVPDGSAAEPDVPERYVQSGRPGGRAPHLALADGRSTLDLFGRGFVLLRLGPAAPDASAIAEAALLRRVPLETVTLGTPEAATLCGASLALVRPDGHVGWRGHGVPADPLVIVDCLRGGRMQP